MGSGLANADWAFSPSASATQSQSHEVEAFHLALYRAPAGPLRDYVLEKDILFHGLSDTAESAFEKMDEKELEAMHTNVITSLGGKNIGKVKRKNAIFGKDKKDTPKEILLDK